MSAPLIPHQPIVGHGSVSQPPAPTEQHRDLTRSLSLYNLDLQLLDMLQAREDVLQSTELTPVEIEQTVASLDHEIAQYLPNALAARAGEVVSIIRQFDLMDEVDSAEIKRLHARKKERADACQYLENLILAVMKRANVKRIEGAGVTLKSAKKPASCDVRQLDMIPREYVRVEVTLTGSLYDRLLAHLMLTEKGAPLFQELMDAKVSQPEPMLSKIKDELKAGASVPGAVLVDDRQRLEIK